MARLASITLLAGAHETGAAHLHETLLSVRGRLAAEGIGVLGPREVRQHLRIALQPEGRSAAEVTALARAALDRLCPGARHIVVMEENTLGSIARAQSLGDNGLLYPFAARRLRTALAAFGGAEVRVGLAIRNPASFLPACWAEQLRTGPWQSFRDFATGFPPILPRWLWLAYRMLPVCTGLTIWKYEDYPAVLPELIDWATGLHGFGATVVPYDLQPYPELPQRGAEQLHAKMASNPGRDHRLPLHRARMAARLRPDLPRFDPWTAAERAAFDASYDDDLLELALATSVRWLTPA